MAAAEVDLVSSLHLHNTTFAGLLQKPGPHSANPAAFFTGTSVFSAVIRKPIREKFSAPSYQTCFLTNHNMFHAADLQLLLLSSNQNTVVHRKWNSNVVFTLCHS